MKWGMFVYATADGDQIGGWLASIDYDARSGRASASFTTHAREAMEFETPLDVLEAWTRQSSAHPLRDDGKPNRPLTAYSISPLPLDCADPLRAPDVVVPHDEQSDTRVH